MLWMDNKSIMLQSNNSHPRAVQDIGRREKGLKDETNSSCSTVTSEYTPLHGRSQFFSDQMKVSYQVDRSSKFSILSILEL